MVKDSLYKLSEIHYFNSLIIDFHDSFQNGQHELPVKYVTAI